MNDLNSILVEGNLTRDPLLSTTPQGTSVCNFAVGSHHMYKKDDEQRTETSFFDVEVWSKLGENCAEYLRKGRGVRVVGRLKQDRWKNGEGQPRSRLKIVAEHVEFRPMKRKDAANPEDPEVAGVEQDQQERDGVVQSSTVPAGDPEETVATKNELVEELSVF
ncbi:MAG: single-stranded DNA-binding protein [Alkalispirochaeta sp.]